MTRALSAFLLCLGWFGVAGNSLAASAETSQQAINELLAKASQAVKQRNYRGVMVYLRSDQLDTLKIIHRGTGGPEAERLISLTGQRREVIRRDGRVTSILPDDKVVLISHRKREGLFKSVAQFSAKRMHAYYEVSDNGTRRLANRVGRLIRIEPRDDYRYGYRMLIDTRTQLPLKLALLRNNDVLEQLVFTQIRYPASIPDSAFEPDYDIEGYRVIKHQAENLKGKKQPKQNWVATNLPPGFELADDGVRQVTRTDYVRQMLFSDGVATVSAFVAPAGLRKPLKGASTMGAVNAFGHTVGDTQITVVGEVPAVTVKQIANCIERHADPRDR